MNSPVVQRILRLAPLACIASTLWAFSKITDLGMSGLISEAIPYVVVACISILLGLVLVIIYQYIKASSAGSAEVDQARAEVEVLARAGRNSQTKASPPESTSNQAK